MPWGAWMFSFCYSVSPSTVALYNCGIILRCKNRINLFAKSPLVMKSAYIDNVGFETWLSHHLHHACSTTEAQPSNFAARLWEFSMWRTYQVRPMTTRLKEQPGKHISHSVVCGERTWASLEHPLCNVEPFLTRPRYMHCEQRPGSTLLTWDQIGCTRHIIKLVEARSCSDSSASIAHCKVKTGKFGSQSNRSLATSTSYFPWQHIGNSKSANAA